MRRLLARAALTAALASVPSIPVTQAAAADAAVCTITGTADQSPVSLVPSRGRWRVQDGSIECTGTLRGATVAGVGRFAGAGSFGALPGGGTCVHDVLYGTVRYTIPTTAGVVAFDEPIVFFAAGLIAFTSPSLAGALVATPPFDGDCVVQPVTRAPFVAQAVLAPGGRR